MYAKNKLRHIAYTETVELYEALRVHADGDMPKDVIEERRPSESDRIKEYREKIFVPITEETVGKVITSLSKIRRSQDWSIDYDPKKVPANIAEGETLQAYCEKNYPYFQSVTNWAFSVLLRAQLLDANAVEVIWPLNWEPKQSEYLRPFTFIYNSNCVLDFVMDDYVVLLSPDKYAYYDNDKSRTYRTDGKIIYVIDQTNIQKWVQVELAGRMSLQESHPHGLPFVPFRRLGGVFYRALEACFIYKSRIQSMVPRLNEAVRIYSDLQAELVQHVHSDKWIYTQTECRHCNGSGNDPKSLDPCACSSCHGVGYVPTSPYTNMVLRPPNNVEGQAQIPTPPAGYIQKADVALMVDRLDNQVDKQQHRALSAINMEFLSKTPLSESGVAKEVDKDETNNFVHSVAEDIVATMDWTYKVINEYRYKDVVPNETNRKGMLPSITVPEKFDLLSSSLLLDDIAKANTNKLNPVILNEMQIEYVAKKFYSDDRVKSELETIFELDPFPNISEDEKMTRLSNDGITQLDYIVSCNIQQFVRRAMQEHENFSSMDMTERKVIIEGYANEVLTKNSSATGILDQPDEVIEEEVV